MKIVFATNNKNKIKEVQKALPEIELVGLKDIGCNEELAEEQDTLQGNAQQKAQYVFENYGTPCFADDTGLLVDDLNGEPGVYSARYAGPDCDSEKNMDLVLDKLGDSSNRKAKFVTVICFYEENGPMVFEGIVEGDILNERAGEEGFGYDPIFQPKGFAESFAQMTMEQKNKISHRGKAVRKFVEFLQK